MDENINISICLWWLNWWYFKELQKLLQYHFSFEISGYYIHCCFNDNLGKVISHSLLEFHSEKKLWASGRFQLVPKQPPEQLMQHNHDMLFYVSAIYVYIYMNVIKWFSVKYNLSAIPTNMQLCASHIILNYSEKISPCGAEGEILQENKIYTGAADALSPCVARSLLAITFTVYDKQAFIFHEEWFKLNVPSCCW